MSTDITYWSITEEKPTKNHHESAYSSKSLTLSNKVKPSSVASSSQTKTVTYDTYSRISSIQYQSGLSLNLTRESTTSGLGRLIGRTYTTSTGQTLSDTITRAVTGDVTSGTELGQTKSYSYDTAGRLVEANVAGNNFKYSYDNTKSATACAAQSTANPTSGRDSNRTWQSINGVETTYCYNQADQLIGSSNPLYDTPAYDTHGNATSLGSGTTKTLFTYDSSDRNTGITETNTTGSTTTTYARDVQGRLTYRHHETNGSNVSNDYYGYTASGDSPDFITDLTGSVTEKYLTLPGDVLITIRPNRTSAGARTYSLPNIHSDIFATIDSDGSILGTYQSGPFGEKLPVQPTSQVLGQTTTQWNTLNGGSFNYVGQHEKLTESDLQLQPIQMGARVYIPGLGRFLSVDPVQGGTNNPYTYPNDPVNDFDLDGNFNWGGLFKAVANVASVVSMIPGPIGMAAAGVSVVAYAAAGDMKSAAIAAACIAVAAIPGAVVAVKMAQAAKSAAVVSKASTIAANAAKGAKGERLVASALRINPLLSVQTARSATGINTVKGMRYSDIITTNRITKTVTRYEVKTGNAIYNPSQRAKDVLIKQSTGQKTRCIRLTWSVRC